VFTRAALNKRNASLLSTEANAAEGYGESDVDLTAEKAESGVEPVRPESVVGSAFNARVTSSFTVGHARSALVEA
jgi:hypothetical protein